MGTNTFRLSRETKKALGENLDFFGSVDQLTKELNLNLTGSDAEDRTETTTLPNGDVSVTFIYSIDEIGNTNPNDGRIYLKDEFIFDPKERELKNYTRRFEPHASAAGDAKWQAMLDRYQKVPALKANDDQVKTFAFRVAQTYSRPLEKPVIEVIKSNADYLNEINTTAEKIDPTWHLRVGDKLTHFSRLYKGDDLIVTVSLPVDADKDATNGRVLFSDQFTLNAKTLELKGVERIWSVAPEVVDKAERDRLKPLVAKLKAANATPDLPKAGKFIAVLGSSLGLEPLDPNAIPSATDIPKNNHPVEIGTGASSFGAFSKRDKGLVAGRQQLAAKNAGIGIALAKDLVERRVDSGKAVLRFSGKIDGAQYNQAVEALFAAALKNIDAGTASSFQEALNHLEPAGDAQQAALRLLRSDTNFQKFLSIADEPDAAIRAKQLKTFAQNDLLTGQLANSAQSVIAEFKSDPTQIKAGEELENILQGKGGFGVQVETLLPRFVDQSANPWMVGGMVASGVLAPFAELGALRLLGRFGKVGSVGRFGARLAGIGAESLAFNAVHRMGASLFNNPGKVWTNFGADVVSGAFLFGALRLSHGGTGYLGGKMAEGRFGTGLGGRMPDGSVALTRWGKRFTELLNHGVTIPTMAGTAALSEKMGIHPASDHGVGGHLFDATVMYTQAMIGGRAAGFLTQGSIDRGMQEVRSRLDREYRAAALDPTVSHGKIARWDGLFTQHGSAAKNWTLDKWNRFGPSDRAGRLFAERALPEQLAQQVMADVLAEQTGITEPSSLRRALSRLKNSAGESLGKWGPTKSAIEYLSLLRLSRQRVLKATLKTLQSDLQALNTEKEAALQTAAARAEEVERLEVTLDDIIEQDLPALVDDPAQLATPELRQAEKQKVKDRVKLLGIERDQAVSAKTKAEELASQKVATAEALETRNQELAQRISELETATRQLETDKQSLVAQKSILESDWQDAEKRVRDANESIVQTGTELQITDRARQDAVKLAAEKEQQIQDLNGRIDDLGRQIAERTTERDTALGTVQARETDIAKQQQKQKQLQIEIDTLFVPVIRDEAELPTLAWAQQPGPELNSTVARQKLQEAETLVTELRTQSRTSAFAARQMMERQSRLRRKNPGQVDLIRANQEALREANTKHEALLAELEAAKAVYTATQIKFFELRLQEENRSREVERQNDSDRFSRLSGEYDTLQNSSTDRISELNANLGAARTEIDRLIIVEGERNQLQTELAQVRETLRQTGETASQWQEYGDRVKGELDGKVAELAATNTRIEELQGELRRVDRELAAERKAKTAAQTENTRLEGVLEDKNTELTNVRAGLAQFKGSAESLEKQKAELTVQLTAEQEKSKRLDQEGRQLAEKANEDELKFAGDLHQKDIEKNELNRRIRELEQAIGRHETEIQELGDSLEVKLAENTAAWEQRLKDELAEQEQLLNKSIEFQTNWAREANERADAQERRANLAVDELDTAKANAEEWQNKFNDADDERTQLAASLAQSAETVASQLERLNELNATLRRLQSDLGQMGRENSGDGDRPTMPIGDAAVNLRLSELEARVVTLKAANERLLASNTQNATTIGELTQTKTDLESERDAALADADQARSELKDHLAAAETVIKEDREEIQAKDEEVKAKAQEAAQRRESRNAFALKNDELLAKVTQLDTQLKTTSTDLELSRWEATELTEEINGLKTMLLARRAATVSPHRFFSKVDPRQDRVELGFNAISMLYRQNGELNGEMHLIAGGGEGSLYYLLPDGSQILGKTTKGTRKKQEDGILASYYYLNNGALVKNLVMADGAGGHGGGKWASTAYLQGGAARIREGAEQGVYLLAGELSENGTAAVITQKNLPLDPLNRDGTGSGTVLTIVGNQATAATSGDSTLIQFRKNRIGRWEAIGYSNVDGMIAEELGIHKNQITKFFHKADYHRYALELQDGDLVITCSDGPWEALIGEILKQTASRDTRAHKHLAHPNQLVFENITTLIGVLEGRLDMAEFLHDQAFYNQVSPGQTVLRRGKKVQLPNEVGGDNQFVVVYQHGKDVHHGIPFPEHRPLETVYDWSATDAMTANAEKSTAKGKKNADEADLEEIPMEDIEEVIPPTKPAAQSDGPPSTKPVPPRPRPKSPPPPPPVDAAPAVPKTPKPDAPADLEVRGDITPLNYDPSQGPLILGREPQGDGMVLKIADTQVSRNHAKVYQHEGKYFLEHIGTSNPTFVKSGAHTRTVGNSEVVEIFDGDVLMLGFHALQFRTPEGLAGALPQSMPAVKTAVYRNAASQDTLGVYQRYGDPIRKLYGPKGDAAGMAYAQLYTNFPEVEGVFNPLLMSQVPEGAAGRHAQEILITGAEKAIEKAYETRTVGSDYKAAAKENLQVLKGMSRPGVELSENAQIPVLQRHDAALRYFFPHKAMEAAAAFARLFQHNPELENQISPSTMLNWEFEFPKKFLQKLTLTVHPDRQLLTDQLYYKRVFEDIRHLSDLIETAYRGDQIRPGQWYLLPGGKYSVGSDHSSNIKLADQKIVGTHFKILTRWSDPKNPNEPKQLEWLIEIEQTEKPTMVNSFALEPGVTPIQNGDMIMAGGQWLQFKVNPNGVAQVEWVRPNSQRPGAPNPWAQAGGFQAEIKLNMDGHVTVLGQMQLQNPLVSGNHLHIRNNGPIFEVRDGGSTNGTTLNGKSIAQPFNTETKSRAEGEWVTVQLGDKLQVGPFLLEVGFSPADNAMTLTAVPYSYNGQNAAPYSPIPVLHDGKLHLNQATSLPIQTVRIGGQAVVEDGKGGHVLNIDSELMRAKRYAVIERDGDAVLLKIEHQGLSIVRGDKEVTPERGEFTLQPGDKIRFKGKEITVNL